MNDEGKGLERFNPGLYTTRGGITVQRNIIPATGQDCMQQIINDLDHNKGLLFSSSYDYPGRYSRWDIGFVKPCLEIRAQGRSFAMMAQDEKGQYLLPLIRAALLRSEDIAIVGTADDSLHGLIKEAEGYFPEEMRSRQPSIFSLIRIIMGLFASSEDHFLGLYGAFGYDLVFQFEDLHRRLDRKQQAADLCLFLPDRILVRDHRLMQSVLVVYDFFLNNKKDLPASTGANPGRPMNQSEIKPFAFSTSPPGTYAALVRQAKQYFARGDLFEVVPSQVLYEDCPHKPSAVFRNLQAINPSPYGFLINLGSEHLVGASPEMFVRVEGDRMETCPISGTIARGRDALEDAEQIKNLLNSNKDEAELTMCTDVDRNDKSRISKPGSVRVIGRRQIELYSHLIHTVDHVEARLEVGYDCLDAFLTHMWAVTVTGAPKKAAMQWLEDHEVSPRGWYGGAVGYVAFDGHLNTGLTLRTIRLKEGQAEIRVGATLLADSVPEEEEAETLLKAAALKKALRVKSGSFKSLPIESRALGDDKRVILVDHEDSFVHTLAGCFRHTGAKVSVLRPFLARETIKRGAICDLLVLSPGPGRPSDFAMHETIALAIKQGLPIFGVCLGLQGLVEYFGGSLDQLRHPQHGKKSLVSIEHPSPLWKGLPGTFEVGRYHSLYTKRLPAQLKSTARTADRVIMAVEHKDLPIFALQFHPESIMTSGDGRGMKIINNLLEAINCWPANEEPAL